METKKESTRKQVRNRELVERYRGGDESAFEELCKENEGLFLTVARRCRHPLRCEADIDDVLACGRIGIFNSIHDYDPEKGEFTTHAFLRIRRAIQEQGVKMSIFFIPADVLKNPSVREKDPEIAAAYERAMSCVARGFYGSDDDREILNHADGEMEVSEPDTRVRAAMSSLTELQRHVIEAYFGFHGGIPINRVEYSKRFGVKRTSVDDRFNRGMIRLRNILRSVA
jgi:RNA polymerase sigma factor (sigma-70 family)